MLQGHSLDYLTPLCPCNMSFFHGSITLIIDAYDHMPLDAPHSVGLLWTSDQLVAETYT